MFIFMGERQGGGEDVLLPYSSCHKRRVCTLVLHCMPCHLSFVNKPFKVRDNVLQKSVQSALMRITQMDAFLLLTSSFNPAVLTHKR